IQQADQNATAAATSHRKDAQQKRSDAADKRAQTDQIEELADAEEQKRPAEPVNTPDPENQPPKEAFPWGGAPTRAPRIRCGRSSVIRRARRLSLMPQPI